MSKFILKFLPLFLLINLSSFASNNYSYPQGSSSIPESSLPWMVDAGDINSRTDVKMRVKIFPHTLRQDWRHGVPDNDKILILKAEKEFNLTLNNKLYKPKNVRIFVSADGLNVILDQEMIKAQKFVIQTRDNNPVTLVRERNLNKLHAYTHRIEVMRVGDRIQVINELPIEDYLRGVVPSESIPSWPLESLKAQAVAARTYAYYHYLTSKKNSSYHVDDTARYQVFTGITHARPSTDKAVSQTRHEILKHKNKVVVAFFHSYSGGTTDSAQNIFKTRSAPYCMENAEVFSRNDLLKEMPSSIHWIVNWKTPEMKGLDILTRLKAHSTTRGLFAPFNESSDIILKEASFIPYSQTVESILVKQGKLKRTIDFTTLRKVIGWTKFPSYHYRIHEGSNNNGYLFRGHGWGHHVGMSQWGAYMMAKHHRADYKDILHHYYHKVDIEEI